ncbi:MAG TPA: TetR/AcrR family transcriptional regulator [Candidatus Dormibacteraeota bacterium]|nr:TetR/AcrR family transcriptional regulator [Candidatus Dormibacteraeota bacterium]
MTYSHIWGEVTIHPFDQAALITAPPASPGRRHRRSVETRERLFRASLDLFAEKGFSETTVEDITNAADVGKGTFFNYFPTKDHILIAFADMQLGKLQAAIDDARRAKEPMPAFLRGLGVRMTAEPARNPSIVRAILQANLSSSPVREAMRANHNRAHQLLTQLIQIGQDRGEIRADLPPMEIAHVFRQTIFGTLLMWSVYGDATLPARIHTAFDLLWRGIAPREARAPTPSSLSS